jgi:diguanylate cyclase (GGDEF)-like protein/PAS domain S-box-containing protein
LHSDAATEQLADPPSPELIEVAQARRRVRGTARRAIQVTRVADGITAAKNGPLESLANIIQKIADAPTIGVAAQALVNAIQARLDIPEVVIRDRNGMELASAIMPHEYDESDLDLPLRCGGEITGFLRLKGNPHGTWRVSAQEQIKALLDLAAIMLLNTGRSDSTGKSHVADLGPTVNASLTDQQHKETAVLSFISEQVCRKLKADFAFTANSPTDMTGFLYGAYAMRSDRWQVYRDQSGEGLTARALQAGRPVAIMSVEHDRSVSSEEAALRSLEGARTLMAVPVIRHGLPLGVITIGWRRAVVVGHREMAEGQAGADQLAAILGDPQGAELLERLSSAVELAMSDADLDVLIPKIVKEAATALEIEQCGMLVVDERNKTLRPMASVGLPVAFFRGFSTVAVGPDVATTGKTVATGATSITVDLMDDPDWEPYRALAAPLGLRSVWATPVINSVGRTLGAFTVYRRRVGAPGPRQLATLELAGSILAAAYNRARRASETTQPVPASKLLSPQLASVIDQLPGGVVVYDKYRHVIYRNEAARAIGYGPGADQGLVEVGAVTYFAREGSGFKKLEPWQRPSIRALRGELLHNFEVYCDLAGREAPDRCLQIHSAPLRDPQSRIIGAILMFNDCTIERRLARELAASEAQMRAMQEATPCGIALFDADGRKLWANAATSTIISSKAAGRMEDIIVQMTDEAGAPLELSDFPPHAALRTGQVIRDQVLCQRAADGRARWLQVDAAPIRDEAGNAVQVVMSVLDITHHKNTVFALKHQAFHDSLTGLANRSKFLEALELAVMTTAADDVLALLLLDVDRFREVNDTLGHDSGDKLVQQLASRLSRAVGPNAVLGRLGGDEFGVLLRNANSAQATAVARNILKVLEPPFEVMGQTFDVDISIGIALSPDHGMEAHTLFRRADVAMYAAKNARDGFAVYAAKYDDMHSPDRLSLLGELRRAVEQGQLFLEYQPQVRMSDYKITGVEALVRWRHPTRGLIAPAQFIQLAEGTGAIKPVTIWVLNEAIRQCSEWRKEGYDLEVAVNLSTRTLHDANLASTITDLLLEHRVPPSRLTLEITESAIMEDPTGAMVVLTRLSNMGILLAIDDFGTGYSSLAYLQRLPAHSIKIDKSFVVRLADNANDAVIVKSIIELGHNLGQAILAEGVENQAGLDILARLGCDAAQGYYLSRPISPGDITELLRKSG